MTTARKRSRIDTEQRFLDAVLALLAESGFTRLGVNSVAECAAADKVLIYRYFGDFDGLLERVAESRSWLPSAEEILSGAGHRPADQLKHIFRRIAQYIKRDDAARQVALWRAAAQNPLTVKYGEEWKKLWKELAEAFSRGVPHQERQKWLRALEILSAMTHSNISGEPVQESWIDFLCTNLEPHALRENISMEQADILPTNLL